MGYSNSCSAINYPKRCYLTSNMMPGNPSKKIRLDFQKKSDGSLENEEDWGEDVLTAEEFDMIEIQATQSCNQSFAHGNNHTQSHTTANNFTEINDLQYELEGRVKLLSHSLEKVSKELNEERIHREQLINERIKVFKEKEANLQKEIEKMQCVLEFKDQEMKSVYNKLQTMKSQFQVRKSTSAETSVNLNFEDFLKSSKPSSSEYNSKPKVSIKFQRKHKLITDTPKGETSSVDILSSILFTRLSLPTFSNYEYAIGSEEEFSNSFGTSTSIMKLKDERNCYELLEYYSCFFKNHIAMLKATACKNNAATSNKSSPISSKRREAGSSLIVISHLQDVAYIFSCSKSNFGTHSANNVKHFNAKKAEGQASSPNDSHNEGDMNAAVGALSKILQLLTELANPKTYPNGYPKNDEIEFSLSALLSICFSNPEKVLDLIEELPVHSLQSPLQNVPAICTTLKLLIVLCSCKNFISFLIHKDNNCVLCLIADYLINIVPHYPETFAVSIPLVEGFLSIVFSTTSFLETLLETSECISEVIQGIIVSVLRYYEVKEKISQSTEIIKKGFLLLHFISYCIPNFKERRNPVENEYISLISNVLTLSKENNEFKEFYDLIHTLWDFQTDISEFDLDDLSDDAQNSTDDMVVEM